MKSKQVLPGAPMLFSHREDPRRTASIRIQAETPAVVVVEHTDGKGACRTKTFKNTVLYRAHDAALRFLLNQEGYVIRGPQDGPLLWMTKLLQDYRGALGHAVDARTGMVWVIDALDHAHRIEPGSCATVSVSLGSAHASPACLAAAGADDAG